MKFRGIAVAIIFIASFMVVAGAVSAASYYTPGAKGYDVSFPQCSGRLPRDGAFGIVGVNNGLPWSQNPCLATQFSWASSKPDPAAFYVNTANPGPQSSYWNLAGPRPCEGDASESCAYNYGWNAAHHAFEVASTATSTASVLNHYWWLDVEILNSWEGTTAANSQTLLGYLDYLTSRGVAGVGIYSTSYQWQLITDGLVLPDVDNWVAGSRTEKNAASYCSASFSGGPVVLVQYSTKSYSGNLVCGSDQSGIPGKPGNKKN